MINVPPSVVSFDQASQAILDAAIDPSRWSDAMELLASYSGATGVVLLPVSGRGPGTPHTKSLEEGLAVYYRDGWHLRDERSRGLPLIRRRGVFGDQDFASREEMATSDYYRGFLAKFDANWSAVVGFSEPNREWCIVFQRGDRQGYFDEREKSDLVRFGYYLSQAAALTHSVAYGEASAAIEAYEAIGCASFLVSSHGRVIRHNEPAERLIGDGLELSSGVLSCSDPASNSGLQKLLAGRLNEINGSSSIIVVNRQTKRPLIIRSIKISGLARSVFSSAATLLLVSNTEAHPSRSTVPTLRSVFNLTPAEAKLASYLEKEVTLSSAAELLKISFETARVHLKHIFLKTGTRRQSELLMLMQRL